MTEATQFVLIMGLFMHNRGVWMPEAATFLLAFDDAGAPPH